MTTDPIKLARREAIARIIDPAAVDWKEPWREEPTREMLNAAIDDDDNTAGAGWNCYVERLSLPQGRTMTTEANKCRHCGAQPRWWESRRVVRFTCGGGFQPTNHAAFFLCERTPAGEQQ
jgi:hypothetical protein